MCFVRGDSCMPDNVGVDLSAATRGITTTPNQPAMIPARSPIATALARVLALSFART